MTPKEKLVLLLVSTGTSLSGIVSLLKIFDHADFRPGIRMGDTLDVLLNNKLIVVAGRFPNNTPATYQVTHAGHVYLDVHLNEVELLDYIKTMQNPDALLELTRAIVSKRKSQKPG